LPAKLLVVGAAECRTLRAASVHEARPEGGTLAGMHLIRRGGTVRFASFGREENRNMADTNFSGVREEFLPDGTCAIRGPRGASIVVNGKLHDVIRMQFVGHLVGEMMARGLQLMDGALAPDVPFSIVVDAEAQSGYEPDVRSMATAWLLRRRERLLPAHLLGRAPMVKMGVQMINNSLGSRVFALYDDRREFERSVGKLLRDSERLRAARPTS
jgi:hypothetical protein